MVSEARSWIGTRYHHEGTVKGAGVDCAMLILRVFVACGFCENVDPRPYPADWMLHRDEERYLAFVLDRCREVQAPCPGDIAVFRWGRCYSHGGIVTVADPLTLVHAYAPAGGVLEEIVASNTQLAQPERRPRFFARFAE